MHSSSEYMKLTTESTRMEFCLVTESPAADQQSDYFSLAVGTKAIQCHRNFGI